MIDALRLGALFSGAAIPMYSAATTHLPENTGDQPLDLIVVELKGKAAKSAKPANEAAK